MKPWSWRKMLACRFSACTCNGSGHSCCNSRNHLQNQLFLLLLCKTWLPVMSLPALSPTGWVTLMWSDKSEEPGFTSSPPELYFTVGRILPGPPARSGQPHYRWHDLGGFQHFPQRGGFITGWSSKWGRVSWCAVTLAFALLKSSHLYPTILLPLGHFTFQLRSCNPRHLLPPWPSPSA